MPIIRKLTDGVRTTLFNALFQPGSLEPNISNLQVSTGLNQATIRNSLEFLKKEIALEFVPRANLQKTGFPLEVITLFRVDSGSQNNAKEAISLLSKDPHCSYFSEISGSQKWNHVSFQLFHSVEECIAHTQSILASSPAASQAIKESDSIYLRHNPIKQIPKTRLAVQLLSGEK